MNRLSKCVKASWLFIILVSCHTPQQPSTIQEIFKQVPLNNLSEFDRERRQELLELGTPEIDNKNDYLQVWINLDSATLSIMLKGFNESELVVVQEIRIEDPCKITGKLGFYEFRNGWKDVTNQYYPELSVEDFWEGPVPEIILANKDKLTLKYDFSARSDQIDVILDLDAPNHCNPFEADLEKALKNRTYQSLPLILDMSTGKFIVNRQPVSPSGNQVLFETSFRDWKVS